MPETAASQVFGKAVDTIRSSAASQAKIINDLLDVSRLKTGKMAMSCRRLDLSDMTRTIVDIVRADPAANGVRIEHGGLAQPLWVYADQTRIEQVIWNLLNNAIKFTPAGGVINVTVSADGQQARLDVVDSGQGITAEFLPKIFDMFGQGTPSIMRGTKGLGIGLAMVKQIVELHNGQVEAASAGSNKGARFTVRLPLDKRQAERGDGVPETIERPLGGVPVLLVDDSQDVLEIFHQLLEMTGASVQGTTSPHEALEWLAGQRFDLLVSDIGMPEMDGFTLIQAVRALESGRDLRAIAVTGYGRQADVERALQTGFDSHINKPVDIDQVVAVALELLRRS